MVRPLKPGGLQGGQPEGGVHLYDDVRTQTHRQDQKQTDCNCTENPEAKLVIFDDTFLFIDTIYCQ